MRNVPWTEGDVIRKLRVIFGFTLEQLAERCDVSFTTISKLELGKTKEARRDTLKKIAAAFGWTAQQIIEAIPTQTIAVSDEVIVNRVARRAKRRIGRIPKPQSRQPRPTSLR